MNRLPTFLIIGAPKAGTTALWGVLRQHPQIYLGPRKEPRFFAFEGGVPQFGGPRRNDYTDLPTITTFSDYSALFEKAGDARAIGEASTIYLYYPGERPAERIKHYLPDVHLIAILRQPAERAYSNFSHAVRLDWEPLNDFRRAWDDEPRRIRDNWSYFLRYRQNGLYTEQLQHYFERFDRQQLRIYLYEDWLYRRDEVLSDILCFLEVDDAFRPASYPHSNVSRLPRIRWLHRWAHGSRPWPRLVTKIIDRLNLYRPVLSPDLKQELTLIYHEEILRLQDLIGRDLSYWLAV